MLPAVLNISTKDKQFTVLTKTKIPDVEMTKQEYPTYSPIPLQTNPTEQPETAMTILPPPLPPRKNRYFTKLSGGYVVSEAIYSPLNESRELGSFSRCFYEEELCLLREIEVISYQFTRLSPTSWRLQGELSDGRSLYVNANEVFNKFAIMNADNTEQENCVLKFLSNVEYSCSMLPLDGSVILVTMTPYLPLFGLSEFTSNSFFFFCFAYFESLFYLFIYCLELTHAGSTVAPYGTNSL